MLSSAQGCFKVPAASAEAVVLTLSGLTANIALQVASCLSRLPACTLETVQGFFKTARCLWCSSKLIDLYSLPGAVTAEEGAGCRQQAGPCRRGRQCW